MFLLYKKFEINYMTLCIPFESFKNKYILIDIVNLHDSK
jgi:hypothetical protein